MILLIFSSCIYHHPDVCITVSDDEDEYEMDASYKKSKTHAVQVYLDEHLLNNNISLKNNWEDGEIMLDDKTTVYINTYPGELKIKIDKRENTDESYEKVKQVCEELEVIIEDN